MPHRRFFDGSKAERRQLHNTSKTSPAMKTISTILQKLEAEAPSQGSRKGNFTANGYESFHLATAHFLVGLLKKSNNPTAALRPFQGATVP